MLHEDDIIPRATESPFLSALHAINDTTDPFGYKIGDSVARGISAASVGAYCTREQVKEILEGKCSMVFGSPEALLNSHRSIFHGKLRKNLKAVFVDESHCIAKW